MLYVLPSKLFFSIYTLYHIVKTITYNIDTCLLYTCFDVLGHVAIGIHRKLLINIFFISISTLIQRSLFVYICEIYL